MQGAIGHAAAYPAGEQDDPEGALGVYNLGAVGGNRGHRFHVFRFYCFSASGKTEQPAELITASRRAETGIATRNTTAGDGHVFRQLTEINRTEPIAQRARTTFQEEEEE